LEQIREKICQKPPTQFVRIVLAAEDGKNKINKFKISGFLKKV